MTAGQTEQFQARLARLRENGHRLPGDPVSPTPSRRRGRTREIAGNALFPLSLAGAFVLGSVSVLVGRIVRFILSDPGGEIDVGMELMIGAAYGAMASFALTELFRLNSPQYRSIQGFGVFAAACLIHNLFHWAPGPMSVAFSPEYVAQMQALTEPNTAIVGGSTIALTASEGDTAAAVAVPGALEQEPAPVARTLPTRLLMDSEKDR